MTRYLLNANIFIQAKNLHYGFDFCPAFWDWIVIQNEAGKVASIRTRMAVPVTPSHEEVRRHKDGVAGSFPNACIGLGLRCMNPCHKTTNSSWTTQSPS